MDAAIHPARTLAGRLVAVMIADGDGFATRPVESATVDFEGFVIDGLRGERHRGHVRAADARVPWYPRGTPIRNSRQVSIVSVEDLAVIAAALAVAELRPEWLGANLVVEGIPSLSMLPRGSRLFLPQGAVFAVEDQNAPCIGTGRAVARQCPGRDGLDFAFVKAARRLRGLVGWVERGGAVRAGDVLSVRVPEQWIYPV